jgi:hypothetical protein
MYVSEITPVLNYIIQHYATKPYGGVEVYLHYLTSALDGGEWPASRPCHFILAERATGTHWTGGCVGPPAGLHSMENRKISCPTGNRTPIVLPADWPLYRLSYPAPRPHLWKDKTVKLLTPTPPNGTRLPHTVLTVRRDWKWWKHCPAAIPDDKCDGFTTDLLHSLDYTKNCPSEQLKW